MMNLARSILSGALLLSAALPSQAQDAEYLLTAPELIGTGEDFGICMTTSVDSLAWLLVSLDPGPMNTKYGSLDLGMPLIFIAPVALPANETMCCEGVVPCEANWVGLTGYIQYVAFHTDGSGDFGISNPASMTIDVGSCTQPGDFYSFTQGGWGTDCQGNNPGCLRDTWFSTVFPNGLVIGDPDGPDGDGASSVLFTDSAAVGAFLPHGGPAAALSGDEVNPASSTGGVLAGQLVAATLNVGFDDAGVFDGVKQNDTKPLGDLTFLHGVDDDLMGRTVREVLDLSHAALAGTADFDLDRDGDADVSLADLVQALTAINENFDNGNQDGGNLSAL